MANPAGAGLLGRTLASARLPGTAGTRPAGIGCADHTPSMSEHCLFIGSALHDLGSYNWYVLLFDLDLLGFVYVRLALL